MIDFDQFWKGVRDEHARSREEGLIEWEIVPRGESVQEHGLCWRVDWIRFASAADTVIVGWLAQPGDHKPNGAGLFWIPGYSYGTPRPDSTNLSPGTTTLCINVHGKTPDEPYINPAGKNDYVAVGIEDPENYIYRRIVLHCLYAVDVFAEIGCVDADSIVVGGMSQGGALALLVAAHHPVPRLCFADMPFLCSIREAMALSYSPVYKAVAALMSTTPRHAKDILDTLCLFDPLYHAQRIVVPVTLSAGGKDPASRPATIEPVFDALGSEIKQYRLFPESGHVFLPEMVETYGNWINWLMPACRRRESS